MIDMQLLAERAPAIRHICVDADGVLKGNKVRLAELLFDGMPAGLREDSVDGRLVRYSRWLACDDEGKLTDSIRYIAGVAGITLFEVADFNTLDGHAFERAVRDGGCTAHVITGRTESLAVETRMLHLPVRVHKSIKDKATFIERELGYSWGAVAFVGDGIQDVPTLERAALSFAPADASDEAKRAAMMVTETAAGEGVVYEVVRAILTARVQW